MERTVVINAVGLTPALLGDATPRLREFAERGRIVPIGSVAPAVTCSVQSTYLTGVHPDRHGVVGNGWYFRDECEIKFWRQSNKLVEAPKVWDLARSLEPSFTCANVCWWYAMHASVDYTVTPRPIYTADGLKIPDAYTKPADLRHSLQSELGRFPLFEFWGPKTSIRSSRWIANAAMSIDRRHRPTLTLVYLPHLDYCLQREGPDSSRVATDLLELDAVCGDLIDHYETQGARVIVLSEYGIEPVTTPVHLNRVLREQGLLAVREELGRELLDPGASSAFAVADHQVAHVYVNDLTRLAEVRLALEETPGVGEVLDDGGKRRSGLAHPRSGDLVAIAEPGAWFTYYYWLDDDRAPDFARTVDIHRKPGYDPVELFVDPKLRFPMVKMGATLLKKKLGFRYLMDVIPLDASLVRGSHGRLASSPAEGPLLITGHGDLAGRESIEATAVRDVILRHLGLERAERHAGVQASAGVP
jgi:predicted AlkP superfamily pyrophosphatase or phosphodiesterase